MTVCTSPVTTGLRPFFLLALVLPEEAPSDRVNKSQLQKEPSLIPWRSTTRTTLRHPEVSPPCAVPAVRAAKCHPAEPQHFPQAALGQEGTAGGDSLGVTGGDSW